MLDRDDTLRGRDRPLLRGYQIDVLNRVDAAIAAGARRVLLVAPTGSGKTVLAGELIRIKVLQGGRVLFFAHRRELISQASQKLYDVRVDHGVILAGHPTRPDAPVQVASVATLDARAIRGSAIEMPPADLVVVDEAHHCRADVYQKIMAAYPDAAIVGLTATPCRGDGRGLGNAFDALIECPDVAELIGLNFLVPAICYAPTEPDLKGIQVKRGDYVEGQLSARMDAPKLVGDVVSHWMRLAVGRKTIVFATGVAHSAHLCDEFGRQDVNAAHLDGGTPVEERERILREFAAGHICVVCNSMILVEGFDEPGVSCLVLARPTKSLGLYRQMIGRGLRTAPGKSDCVIIDHAGAVFEHGMPDDPIEWSLSEDRRAASKKHSSSKSQRGDAPRFTTCPECTAVRMTGRPCAACGWRPAPKAQPVAVVDGDLARVERGKKPAPATASLAQQKAFFAQLRWWVVRYGKKPGWASISFKEKFARWPDWAWQNVDPVEPDASVRAWVRSRQIAFARAQDRRERVA